MQTEVQEFSEDAFIAIPDELLLELGLVEGMMFDISVRNGNIVMSPIGREILGDDASSALLC